MFYYDDVQVYQYKHQASYVLILSWSLNASEVMAQTIQDHFTEV